MITHIIIPKKLPIIYTMWIFFYSNFIRKHLVRTLFSIFPLIECFLKILVSCLTNVSYSSVSLSGVLDCVKFNPIKASHEIFVVFNDVYTW
jgi:hypothetical protein